MTAVPPALPGTAQSKRLKESHEFTRLRLGKADMRVVCNNQMTPVAPSSVTPAKAGVQSPKHSAGRPGYPRSRA
jgi:hypothetical protein